MQPWDCGAVCQPDGVSPGLQWRCPSVNEDETAWRRVRCRLNRRLWILIRPSTQTLPYPGIKVVSNGNPLVACYTDSSLAYHGGLRFDNWEMPASGY